MGIINENLTHIKKLQEELIFNLKKNHTNMTDDEVNHYIENQISIRIFKKSCSSESDILRIESEVSALEGKIENNSSFKKI